MASSTVFGLFKAKLDVYAAQPGALPVIYENEFFQNKLDANVSAFVFAEVFDDAFWQMTTGAPGSNLWEERGVMRLHVMVASGTGTADARAHAHDLMYLFREQPLSGIYITEMSIGAGDPGRDFPNYYSIELAIYWSRLDITSIPSP